MSKGNGSGNGTNGAGRNGTLAGRDEVRVAIVGVGNCASSFVQGVEFYARRRPRRAGPRAHARRPRWLPRP